MTYSQTRDANACTSQFELPAVFTIGPADDVASLMKYAVLLTGDSDGQPQGHSGTLGTGRNHVQGEPEVHQLLREMMTANTLRFG